LAESVNPGGKVVTFFVEYIPVGHQKLNNYSDECGLWFRRIEDIANEISPESSLPTSRPSVELPKGPEDIVADFKRVRLRQLRYPWRNKYDLELGPERVGEDPANFVTRTSGTFTGENITEMPNQNNFSRPAPSGFEDMNFEGGAQFLNYITTQLPLLRIPEETYIPSSSYTQDNSPWCSSTSDSTFSNHSDGSRNGRHWPRGRSDLLADWLVSAGPTQ
jgi:hypothetical protein